MAIFIVLLIVLIEKLNLVIYFPIRLVLSGTVKPNYDEPFLAPCRPWYVSTAVFRKRKIDSFLIVPLQKKISSEFIKT